jgi:hypothetical protein
VDFVDEQDGVGVVLQLLDHLFHPFLEVAAIAGAGQQRSHVEAEDGRLGQHLRHLVTDDLARQALGDGGLANARITHEQRVVIVAPTQDLDAALDLDGAADEGIDLTLPGLLVEVDAIGLESLAAGLDLGLFLLVAGALGRPRYRRARLLGDAMGDEVDGVVTGHLLLLQEVGGVAFALGEYGHQNIGPGDVVASRRLHVDHRALDDSLETGGGLGVLAIINHQ